MLFYTYEDPLCLFLYAQDGTILIHRFCIALAGRDILLAHVAWRSLACSPRSRVSLALRGFLLEFMRSSLAPLPWSERILVPAQLAGVARGGPNESSFLHSSLALLAWSARTLILARRARMVRTDLDSA